MRLARPFIKLPFNFDHERLAEEIAHFGEEDWRPHPQRFEGNSSLILVSTHGGENDDFGGPMKPNLRLGKTPYIRQVMGTFNTVIGRSRLMRLTPGASVDEHTDGHYFWRNHLRIHIPIITDPRVAFSCGPEDVHMAAGESWTFNNWLPHSVHNGSDKARIHLVIDTVGSADLWRAIDGRDGMARRIDFDDGKEPQLRFEGFRGVPVLSPTELRDDLQELVEDIAEYSQGCTELKAQLRLRTADFIHEWQSHWMVHGPTLDGFPGFKSLLEAFRRDIERVPNELAMSSNNASFKKAITYTLDASLVAENLTAPGSGDTGASVRGQRPRFDRPVFIVAAPRSGSTLLFETLAVNRELWTVGDESHKHFESIAPLRPNQQNPSNRLTSEMATAEIIDTLMDFFVADLMNSDGKPFAQLSALARPTELRFLEKTPKNALRIPFITKAFPDARFIFLFRDARQNISSLLDSWRSRRFVTYPKLPGWPPDTPWSHVLIPGWQNLIGRSLAEITARQWLVTNQYILDDLKELQRERWCAIEYDSLISNTAPELKRLCHFAQLIFGPRMHEIASNPLQPSKYTLTSPHPEKWKRNAAELEPVIPATEEMMTTLRALGP